MSLGVLAMSLYQYQAEDTKARYREFERQGRVGLMFAMLAVVFAVP